MHNQCKPYGGGGAQQGVGIWPRSKYCGQISKGGAANLVKNSHPGAKYQIKAHTFNNLWH